MIHLETIELLKITVALVVAYCMIAGITGAFQAWVAYLCGDDTAREQGMTNINPFVHIDPLSLVLVPLGYILFKVVVGLSRPVPIDWRNISAPKRRLKITLVALAQPIAILLLLVSLIFVGHAITAGLRAFGGTELVPTAAHVYTYILGAVFGFSAWFIPYQLLMSIAQLYVEHEHISNPMYAMLIVMIAPLLGAILLVDVSRTLLIKLAILIESGLLSGVHHFFG